LSDLWDEWGGEARAEVQRKETGDRQAVVPEYIDVDVEESPCKEGGSGIVGVLTGNIAAVPELVGVVDGNLTVGNEVVNLGVGHELLDDKLIDDDVLLECSVSRFVDFEDWDAVDESILHE